MPARRVAEIKSGGNFTGSTAMVSEASVVGEA